MKELRDVSIVLSGEAGQGLKTVEEFLVRIFKLSGFHVFATKEYMSRVRGGNNTTEIRVSSGRVAAFTERIDLLVLLNASSLKRLEKRISPDTVILGEKETVEEEELKKGVFIEAPFTKIAVEAGNSIFSNVAATGVIAGIFGMDENLLAGFVERTFREKKPEIIDGNKKAAHNGYAFGLELVSSGKTGLRLGKASSAAGEILLNGAEALSLGALAGGCNFIAAYPMSPSTGVLTYLAQHAAELGIVSEQAEDEIAAINMTLGAWYAGARALASTSGGGFALMEEGVSLCGMLEVPAVIHIAQRPGPATGLPTRTEQGDLEFALYSGHGEFPRIIFAPGKLEDTFLLTRKAFELADRFQIPVFILTDQHLMDSYYNIPQLPLSGEPTLQYFQKTEKDYRRYRITPDGISPRGIPGYGEGLVCVDSDEHDEEGHITEDMETRVAMVDKRLKKMDGIIKETVSPELTGDENYETLVVGWGSTYHVIREALEVPGFEKTSFLHFGQVYPLHPDTGKYLRRAKKVILVENNATAQFGKLLKLHADFDAAHRILKYDGLPFSVEGLREELKKK